MIYDVALEGMEVEASQEVHLKNNFYSDELPESLPLPRLSRPIPRTGSVVTQRSLPTGPRCIQGCAAFDCNFQV